MVESYCCLFVETLRTRVQTYSERYLYPNIENEFFRRLCESHEGLSRFVFAASEATSKSTATQSGTADLVKLFFEMLRFQYHHFIDIGSGTSLPMLTFLIKEFLFEKSKNERIGFGVEMVLQKHVISEQLICVFKNLEGLLNTVLERENVTESRTNLFHARFETTHSETIAKALKEKKTILYLNNAADGFDDRTLHQTVVELALATSALVCVANPMKLNASELFDHFAVEHVSRNMFQYKECSHLYLFTCISGQLKTKADVFARTFQSELQERTTILNSHLSATEMLAMSCSPHKASFKDLNYDEVVVDCAMVTLEKMHFDTLS
jgi:hypothetical protein